MSTNDVCDLVAIPNGAKTMGCKWDYKTKHDSKGNFERFKARLVAKASLRERAYIILKPSRLSQLKIHSE